MAAHYRAVRDVFALCVLRPAVAVRPRHNPVITAAEDAAPQPGITARPRFLQTFYIFVRRRRWWQRDRSAIRRQRGAAGAGAVVRTGRPRMQRAKIPRAAVCCGSAGVLSESTRRRGEPVFSRGVSGPRKTEAAGVRCCPEVGDAQFPAGAEPGPGWDRMTAVSCQSTRPPPRTGVT